MISIVSFTLWFGMVTRTASERAAYHARYLESVRQDCMRFFSDELDIQACIEMITEPPIGDDGVTTTLMLLSAVFMVVFIFCVTTGVFSDIRKKYF